MQLDLRTLFIVLAILYACLGFVCLFLPYRTPGSHAVTNWGYGLLALAAGTAALALRGAIPDYITIDLANALILAAFLFILRSVRQDRKRVERVRLERGRRGGAAALVFHLFAAGHARPHCGFFRRDGAARRPAGRRADRGGPRGRQAGADIYGGLPGRRRPGDACARGLDHPARLERGSACARFRPVREQSAVRRVRRAGDAWAWCGSRSRSCGPTSPGWP